jgi:dTDP-4-amino-4,6-dideoxygalactose transaminase
MSVKVPLLDLKREYAELREELEREWGKVLSTMHLLKGANVAAFEREIAQYTGTRHAVGVASGTDALCLTLRALGISHGHEVLLHANAFVAALEAIHHAGARPVLVDVATEHLGPDLDELEQHRTPRTRAVIAVHLYGLPLPMEELVSWCQEHGILLVEDCSHAHGAGWFGRKVGSFGQAGCFSAGVVKNLGAYGDAGFVTTDLDSLASRVRLLQAHGQARKNQHELYGFNSRLDELQATVLRVKLRYLDKRNERRRRIAAYYRERFAGLPLQVPREPEGAIGVYHQFVLRTAQRDGLQAHLHESGVETGIHYPVPLHLQPAWQSSYGTRLQFPRAETLAREILSIPVFPDLTDAEVEHVAESVRRFFRR